MSSATGDGRRIAALPGVVIFGPLHEPLQPVCSSIFRVLAWREGNHPEAQCGLRLCDVPGRISSPSTEGAASQRHDSASAVEVSCGARRIEAAAAPAGGVTDAGSTRDALD